MEKADDLINRLTLEEMVSLLSGQDFWSVNPIERLGTRTLRVTDGPNGARGGGSLVGGKTAACYPCGIAIGATWDPNLAQEIGADLAKEVKSKNAHVSLAPTCNIHRSVTNGRNFECYSEDPELSAALAVGAITGLQQGGVAATVKHYVGNESEIERTTISSEIDERSLREVYLRPFEDAVKKARTWAIMSSYNRLNGTYTSEHLWLLTTVLREEWGFDGVVMSDWFGSHSTAPTVNAGLDLEMPGKTRDRGAKLIAAVEAGAVKRETIRARALNMLRLMERVGSLNDHRPFEERSENRPETRALIRRAGAAGAVLLKNEGILPLDAPGKIAVIGPNAKAARIMGGGSAQLNPHVKVSPWDGLKARFGEDRLIFAPGCTNHRWEPLWQGAIQIDYFDNFNLSGEPVYIEMAENAEAMWIPPFAGGVLDLKHFSARISGTYIAQESGVHRFGLTTVGYGQLFVDGRLVTDAKTNWTKGRTFFEEGCDEVVGETELQEGQSYEIAVEFVAKPDAQLLPAAYRAGIGIPMGNKEIFAAAEVARAADVALVLVGRNGEWDTEGSDLENIALPGRQDELVRAVAAANPNTVVVLQTGGPVEMPWIDDVPAVLQAWYPGQEAGHSIADVLSGDAEPGGRLPQTFPRQWADNPTHSNDAEVYPGQNGKVRYAEGVFTGHRHYDLRGIKPLFAFGHGLSYTSFDLTELAAKTLPDGDVEVQVTVANTGERSGSTVVQLYVGDLEASLPRPLRELKAFYKIKLDPAESRRLSLFLTSRDFAFFDINSGAWRVEAGRFTLSVGFAADDLREEISVDMLGREIAV